jgi:hypothetical protein
MASKIDPFRAEVFEQLNAFGLSYRSVCRFLLDKGVEVSPQALRTWHLRRSKKIRSRGALIPPDPASPQTERGSSLKVSTMGRPNVLPMKEPLTSPSKALNRTAKLKHEIEKQEQRLSAAPFSPGYTSLLVRPKR